ATYSAARAAPHYGLGLPRLPARAVPRGAGLDRGRRDRGERGVRHPGRVTLMSAADLGLQAAQPRLERVGPGARRTAARGADELAGLALPPVPGEQRNLGEACLVPRRASGRARLERAPPVPERRLPVAGVGRGPGGAAQRLRRRRIPLQRLLVETSGSRRVTRAQGEIGEGDAIARVARLARERLV